MWGRRASPASSLWAFTLAVHNSFLVKRRRDQDRLLNLRKGWSRGGGPGWHTLPWVQNGLGGWFSEGMKSECCPIGRGRVVGFSEGRWAPPMFSFPFALLLEGGGLGGGFELKAQLASSFLVGPPEQTLVLWNGSEGSLRGGGVQQRGEVGEKRPRLLEATSPLPRCVPPFLSQPHSKQPRVGSCFRGKLVLWSAFYTRQ